MTPPDEAERCERCDREECCRDLVFNHDDACEPDCEGCACNRDCDAHAMDWRSRCLAAESEVERGRRLSDAAREALRAAMAGQPEETADGKTFERAAACIKRLASASPVLPADVAALLAEWKRLASEVTRGPWFSNGGRFVAANDADGIRRTVADCHNITLANEGDNAVFIAAARTGWTRAVEIIEALLKERAK